MNRSRESDAVGGMAEDPPCLYVVSAPGVNLGTKDCSSATICPAGAPLGRKHRLGASFLWHAFHEADEGRPDLPQNRKPPRRATSPRPYKVGEHRPISRD